MAKKGGAQQLQTEINSDEDLYKFLERPGLLVMDVYSEWCGPCLAMVGPLRKIKLELGGDNLQLAICKSDNIEALKRFRNKSEPTWLFANGSRCCNLMFGTEVPKLMNLITEELKLIGSTKRPYYDITELQPEEQARRDVFEKAANEARQREIEEQERQRLEYLNHVTDEIIKNLPDMGVTIFGPHVGRDVYKKLMEIADSLKIQCKDRRNGPILPQHFEVVNYACENPIPPEVLEHMYGKDLLICFWKVSDSERLPELFLNFVHEVTTPRKGVTDTGEVDPDQTLPPLLTPLEIRIAKDEPEKEPEAEVEEIAPVDDFMAGIGPLPGEQPEEPAEGVEQTEEQEAEKPPEESEEAKLAEAAASDENRILVPPIWVPTDRRTHATLIYVFFRAQTVSFLEPDPVPDPPHLIMAFDAYKRKDIFRVIEKNKENVLLYGFFTNDNPDTASLIANTLHKYEAVPSSITDKLILKVAKNTSHTMLAFAEFGPSYVSHNTVVGKEEALKLFPEGYDVQDAEPPPEEDTKKAKGAKEKKPKSADPPPEKPPEPPHEPEPPKPAEEPTKDEN